MFWCTNSNLFKCMAYLTLAICLLLNCNQTSLWSQFLECKPFLCAVLLPSTLCQRYEVQTLVIFPLALLQYDITPKSICFPKTTVNDITMNVNMHLLFFWMLLLVSFKNTYLFKLLRRQQDFNQEQFTLLKKLTDSKRVMIYLKQTKKTGVLLQNTFQYSLHKYLY